MCIPINKKEAEIKWNGTYLNYNNHKEISNKLPLKSPSFWYLIGRFIGDGWIVKRKDRNNNISGIKICCAKDELKDLENKLCHIFNYCVVEDKTTYKLQFSNKELGEFCKQFGVGAKNKHIPQYILDSRKEDLEYLLMGIIDSDGCYSQGRYKITTISRDLAYNIGELILKLKKVPYHIYKTVRPKKYRIEERIINQNNTYQITWSNIYNKNINFVDENYLYSKIRKIENRIEINKVYNIEVENTHSYCVNNIATHNCQDFSVAGKQAGGDVGSGTRSSLMYETIRIVGKLRPKYVVWENVKNLLSKKHKHNFDAYIETMKNLGYVSYYEVLNAKDYGIPQNRERVFTISIRKDIDMIRGYDFEFPEKEELNQNLQQLLEKKVDEKYFVSEKGKKYILKRAGNYVQLIDENTMIAHCPITAVGNANWTGNFVKFEFPPKEELSIRLKDILEQEVDEKYYLKDYQIENIKKSSYIQNQRRIQEKDWCDTLCARDWKDPKCVQIGNLKGGKWDKINESCRRVYSEEGLSPTVHTCQGGNTEPKVGIIDPKIEVVGNYMPSGHDASRIVDSKGIAPTVKENHGTVTAITEEKNMTGIDLTWNEIGKTTDIGRTLTTSCRTLCKNQFTTGATDGLRIRKLTPKECWRLMGFDDEDFEKAAKVNSNTQLYKQARKFNRSKSIRKNLYKFIERGLNV